MTSLKEKLLIVLKEAIRAAVSAFLAALGLAASTTASGCTTVMVPEDSAAAVSVTGALPVGIQVNK